MAKQNCTKCFMHVCERASECAWYIQSRLEIINAELYSMHFCYIAKCKQPFKIGTKMYEYMVAVVMMLGKCM